MHVHSVHTTQPWTLFWNVWEKLFESSVGLRSKLTHPRRTKNSLLFRWCAHAGVDLVTAKALIFPDDYNASNFFLLVVLSVWSLLPSSLTVSPDWLIARTLSVKTLVERKGARERVRTVPNSHEPVKTLSCISSSLWTFRIWTSQGVCMMFFSLSTEDQHLLKWEQSKEPDGSSSPHTGARAFSVGL